MKIAIFTNPEKENNELKDSISRVASFVGFKIDEENPDVVLRVVEMVLFFVQYIDILINLTVLNSVVLTLDI